MRTVSRQEAPVRSTGAKPLGCVLSGTCTVTVRVWSLPAWKLKLSMLSPSSVAVTTVPVMRVAVAVESLMAQGSALYAGAGTD